MKFFLSLCLVLLCSCCVEAQDCKPYKDEIDVITKKRKVIYKTKPVVGAWFVASDSLLHLELGCHFRSLVSIHDGAPVTFLFTDGSTLELLQVGHEVADYLAGTNYRLSTFLWLTADDLEVLATRTTKLVRFRLSDHNHDREYKPGLAAELLRAARCLREAIRTD